MKAKQNFVHYSINDQCATFGTILKSGNFPVQPRGSTLAQTEKAHNYQTNQCFSDLNYCNLQ